MNSIWNTQSNTQDGEKNFFRGVRCWSRAGKNCLALPLLSRHERMAAEAQDEELADRGHDRTRTTYVMSGREKNEHELM